LLRSIGRPQGRKRLPSYYVAQSAGCRRHGIHENVSGWHNQSLQDSAGAWHKVPMRKHVPLSQRTTDELRAQAELYQQMAATARTPEALRGLESLAVRFARLAEQRAAAESRGGRVPPDLELSNAAD